MNGSLGIELVNSSSSSSSGGNHYPVTGVYTSRGGDGDRPSVGVEGVLKFNDSAVLTVAILGSVRTIRDFTEGGGILRPEIQDGVRVRNVGEEGVVVERLWLDNVTSTALNFSSVGDGKVSVDSNGSVKFEAGKYRFSAEMDYPQLSQLNRTEVFNSQSGDVVKSQPDDATALTFLSYSDKLLAGAWRFLTYFGRDSMISALLLDPVLSYGEGSAMEAVIGAVLERIDRSDGSVCHEETIGFVCSALGWLLADDLGIMRLG